MPRARDGWRLFHYTTHEFASECRREFDALGVYIEPSDGLYGPGIYALDLAPGQASRDELRWHCFGDARPDHPMDGALAIDASLSVRAFERVDSHIWLLSAALGSPVPADHMIDSIATWTNARGWELHDT